jgi:hypothetical protein
VFRALVPYRVYVHQDVHPIAPRRADPPPQDKVRLLRVAASERSLQRGDTYPEWRLSSLWTVPRDINPDSLLSGRGNFGLALESELVTDVSAR